MPTCKLIRAAVLTAATLLFVGILMEVGAQTLAHSVTANVIAIMAALASPAIMLLALAVGLLPARITRLDECLH
jgi:hypothetical protein